MRLKTKYLILGTNTTLTAVANRLPDHIKYITTPEFNKIQQKILL